MKLDEPQTLPVLPYSYKQIKTPIMLLLLNQLQGFDSQSFKVLPFQMFQEPSAPWLSAGETSHRSWHSSGQQCCTGSSCFPSFLQPNVTRPVFLSCAEQLRPFVRWDVRWRNEPTEPQHSARCSLSFCSILPVLEQQQPPRQHRQPITCSRQLIFLPAMGLSSSSSSSHSASPCPCSTPPLLSFPFALSVSLLIVLYLLNYPLDIQMFV